MQRINKDGPLANWLYFAHPTHRQGLLLGLPEKTSLRGRGGGTGVSFPMMAKQEVILRFASQKELKELFNEDKGTPK